MWHFVKSVFKLIKELLSFLTIGLNEITHELDKLNQAYHKKHSHNGTLDNVIDYVLSKDTFVNLNKTQLSELKANHKAGLYYKKPKEGYYIRCIKKDNRFFDIKVINDSLFVREAKQFSTIDDFKEIYDGMDDFFNNRHKNKR